MIERVNYAVCTLCGHRRPPTRGVVRESISELTETLRSEGWAVSGARPAVHKCPSCRAMSSHAGSRARPSGQEALMAMVRSRPVVSGNIADQAAVEVSLGLSVGTMSKRWATLDRSGFPPPIQASSSTPLWDLGEVAMWARVNREIVAALASRD